MHNAKSGRIFLKVQEVETLHNLTHNFKAIIRCCIGSSADE